MARGYKTGGRKKGSLNKITNEIKAASFHATDVKVRRGACASSVG
jgi:hypothetical protein